jgi:hypothetical protein
VQHNITDELPFISNSFLCRIALPILPLPDIKKTGRISQNIGQIVFLNEFAAVHTSSIYTNVCLATTSQVHGIAASINLHSIYPFYGQIWTVKTENQTQEKANFRKLFENDIFLYAIVRHNITDEVYVI